MSAPDPQSGHTPLDRYIARLHFTEDAMLVILITVMAALAIFQIFLRNFFHGGLVWVEPMLRSMVLWVAMFGAMVATRDNRHIRIDVLTHYFPVAAKPWINVITHSFSSAVCLLIAWHSARFVGMETEQLTLAFAFVPTWVVASAIPLAFLVIAMRFALYAWRDVNSSKGQQS